MSNLTTPDGQSTSQMSQITIDSAETVLQETDTTSVLGYEATEWTNEKHCKYLKSMEESFVNELYCSMGLLRGQAQKSVLENKAFVQRESIRDGNWKGISVNGYGNKLEANPWIRHFRHSGKRQVVEGAVSNSRQSASTPSRQDFVGDDAEMSGQNFDNDDGSIKSYTANLAKRKQMATTNVDSDQVVPGYLTSAHDCKRKALNYRF